VDNNEMYLGDTGCSSMDWTGLAQDRDKWRVLGDKAVNLPVPKKCWEILE
jgi:hypothetical protein